MIRRRQLYGLEAISFYNVWAMALTGALIVLSGLAALSIIISQLPKIIAILEHREEKKKQRKELSISPEAEEKQEWIVPDPFPMDIGEAASIYRPLIDQLEQPFRLSQLYEIARKHDLPHPHLTIDNFRNAEILVNMGDGFFTWNQQ